MKGSFLAFLIAVVGGSVLIPTSAGTIKYSDQRKGAIIKQIKASSTIQIYADNSQGSSLYIRHAAVREISGDEFLELVGEPARHSRQTTFPEVVLLNADARTIKSFAIVVQSSIDKPKSGYVLLKKGLSVLPNSTYEIASREWPPADKVSIQSGNKFVSHLQQPGLDSPKSWLPGAASDLRITIGLVEFEDGTRWKISPDSNW